MNLTRKYLATGPKDYHWHHHLTNLTRHSTTNIISKKESRTQQIIALITHIMLKIIAELNAIDNLARIAAAIVILSEDIIITITIGF